MPQPSHPPAYIAALTFALFYRSNIQPVSVNANTMSTKEYYIKSHKTERLRRTTSVPTYTYLIQVWCVGSGDNRTPVHINKTVAGNTLSTVFKALMPGVLYQVEVAAVTSAGVGTRSQPVSVLVSELPTVPLPR